MIWFLFAPGNRLNPAFLFTNNALHSRTPTWNHFPFIPLSLSHRFPNHPDATLMPASTTLTPRWQLLFFLPSSPSVRVRTHLNTILTWKNEGISCQSDRVELNNPPWFFRVHPVAASNLTPAGMESDAFSVTGNVCVKHFYHIIFNAVFNLIPKQTAR